MPNDNNTGNATAASSMPLLPAADISKILESTGPVVNAVLLKATGFDSNAVIETIQVDTTPKKQMCQQILGGTITFLGQYEDEGIVLMIRRDQDNPHLPVNPHRLQAPFRETTVRGDVLLLKVAAIDDDDDDKDDDGAKAVVNSSNEEFFLNYTGEEYRKFAMRTDVRAVSPVIASNEKEKEEEMDDEEEESDEEIEGEDDSEDEDGEEGGGLMDLLMGQVLQRFQQENGRLPDEQELQALEAAIAQKLGGMVPVAEDDDGEE